MKKWTTNYALMKDIFRVFLLVELIELDILVLFGRTWAGWVGTYQASWVRSRVFYWGCVYVWASWEGYYE